MPSTQGYLGWGVQAVWRLQGEPKGLRGSLPSPPPPQKEKKEKEKGDDKKDDDDKGGAVGGHQGDGGCGKCEGVMGGWKAVGGWG